MTPVISAQKLRKIYAMRGGSELVALNDVNIEIYPGEILGLVGESGSGKSTLGKCLIRAIRPDGGNVLLKDGDSIVDITHMNYEQIKPYREKMQMVFQDVWSSLNPRMTMKEIISEPMVISGKMNTAQINGRLEQLLEMVGLSAEQMNRYPYAFSGGQRQRIGIARAIAMNPDFLICDEAVSALDVSVRAQILNLLTDFNRRLKLSMLFITHDMSVIRYISHRIAVMYLGRIVESGGDNDIFNACAHPYTRMLLAAVPRADPDMPLAAPDGEANAGRIAVNDKLCSFYPRCAYANERCKNEIPALKEISPGHFAACHYPLNE